MIWWAAYTLKWIFMEVRKGLNLSFLYEEKIVYKLGLQSASPKSNLEMDQKDWLSVS